MSAPFDKRRSLAVGRWRIIEILKRIADHPCSQDDLRDIVPDPKALSRIMAKLVLKRKCHMTTVQLYDLVDAPRRIYSGYRVNTPAHDHALTKALAALGYPACERGPMIQPVGVGEDVVRPDAVTLFNKKRNWEMDMGTEGYLEIEKKVKAYQGQASAVLWVCLTEARRQKLIEWTKPIHHFSFYALLSDIVGYPTYLVWKTASGKDKAIRFVPDDVTDQVPEGV